MGFVDFLRGLMGWWSKSSAPPPTVRDAVFAGAFSLAARSAAFSLSGPRAAASLSGRTVEASLE